ncbi:MAG TPA: response regulator [Candidatus Elarobacter sp.]|nr:response regulator [Candidatus Elarobacter sp.]
MTRVYVVEPQTIFGPEVQRIVGEAGGSVASMSPVLDLDDIIEARPDVVLLDLDYTDYDPAEVLDALREEAPSVRPIVLTSERERGRLDRFRSSGAASVVSKSADDAEVIRELRVILGGGAVWDARVEAA